MKKAISGEEKYFDNTSLGYSIGFSKALPVASRHKLQDRDDHHWRCQGERFTG